MVPEYPFPPNSESRSGGAHRPFHILNVLATRPQIRQQRLPRKLLFWNSTLFNLLFSFASTSIHSLATSFVFADWSLIRHTFVQLTVRYCRPATIRGNSRTPRSFDPISLCPQSTIHQTEYFPISLITSTWDRATI